MASSTRLLAWRTLKFTRRNYSAIAERAVKTENEQPTIQTLRTSESNPANHNQDHLCRFYTVPPDFYNQIFFHAPFPTLFEDHVKTFNELALLIRKPAVEIISYLQQTDYSRPVNKFVVYGETGTGKTLTLAHILHYGAATNKILIHLSWPLDLFMKNFKEKKASETRENLYDKPVDGAAWLLQFKHQNASLLASLDLKIQNEYVWNPREKNAAGSPLLQLVDFGIARVRYSCDVLDAVINELKIASNASKCTCLVVIDGFNAFFGTESRVKDVEYKLVYADRLTIAQSFLNITKYDWCNGAVVVSVDKLAREGTHRESYYPRYLLGEKGFEFLDPFLPIQTTNYTKDEFDTVMDYYRDRMWIRNISKNGQREIELLTNRNPLDVMKYTNPL